GDVALARGDVLDSLDGGGGEEGDPEAAVGGEVLLGGEVVDVGFGDVEVDAPGSGGSVDDGERGILCRPGDGGHHAGGGLVVGPRVHVEAGVGVEFAARPGGGGDDAGGHEEGGVGGGGEFGAELAEAEVLAAGGDEGEGGSVPERGGAAITEYDFVAVGEAEQVGEAAAHPADEVFHGRLTVRGAEQARGCGERVELLGPHLGGAAAEASVAGEQVGWDCHRGHASSYGGCRRRFCAAVLRPALGLDSD